MNGMTKTLSPENSSYVQVDNRINGDAVLVEEYLLGHSDSMVADFEVRLATPEGVGSISEKIQ